jgi:lipopolysaccharide/colanic/teichoic acid biosynthesis glycosyltransferase
MMNRDAVLKRPATGSAVNQHGEWIDVRPIPIGKRALDVVLSGAGLLVSAPVWAALAAAIKVEDRGPVFFAQERVGQGGRIFRALKFRSMIPNAEAGIGAVQATARDPRVTRIGRVMRATAMDELPQLWNIFVGERHSVRPGLTGIAQIFAPRDVPRRHKFKYDRIYIDRQTWALDLRLILLSFWITFRGKWEHREKKF